MPGETVHLYGRNPAIELVGRNPAIELVFEFITRPERNGIPYSQRVPILVFTGGRSSGKTALLTKLTQQLDQKVPFARIDCETADSTTAQEVLSGLTFELNRKCGKKYGHLPFPRFIIGQLIIAQKLDTTNRRHAREQVQKVLEEHRKIDKLREFLTEIAPAVISEIPGAQQIPGVSVAGRYLPGLVLDGLIAWKHGRRVALGEGQHWYGHQDRGLEHEPLDQLVDLNRRASRPDIAGNQHEVSELLWAAFLADLRNAFRKSRRADEWGLSCVVLVDNIDVMPIPSFLDELISARRHHSAYSPDDPDPLAIVATSRGALSARVTPTDESVPTAEKASYHHYLEYLERTQGKSECEWYPVTLRDLTKNEVGNMVAARRLSDTRRVETMVHRFTDGHPGSTRLVLDALSTVANLPANTTGTMWLRTVLKTPFKSTSTTVEEQLLDQFLQDVPAGAVHDLITCAAARDIYHASQLETAGLLTGSRAERSAVFTPELWTPTNGANASVLRPTLRRLLLRQLALRPANQPTSWSSVHSRLQQSCLAVEDEAGGLYYALALGDVEFVARRLAELLLKIDIHSWLRLLETVIVAPNRLDHQGVPNHHVTAQACWTDPQDIPLAPLARLITALWIENDPLGDSLRGDLYREIAADYEDVAPHSGNGSAALRKKADNYRAMAQLWDLPRGVARLEESSWTNDPEKSLRGTGCD